MATQQRPTIATYRCPECEGDVTAERGTWQCADCGHVPHHGAD